MKILLDENMPKPLKHIFRGHSATTVQEEGLAGTRNGDLLARIAGTFDAFITGDKNLRYQQNLTGRTVAILELPTNRLPLLRPMFQRIVSAVDDIKPGDYIQLAL